MNTSKQVVTGDLQLADPYSSSSSSSPPTYDVFLSFYGKETRRNFTSHLYSALNKAGFLTFRDDPALEKGQEISSGLLDAIKHSKIFIVVVSESYARSAWCLNELVEILICKSTEVQVIPVFYYVEPSDVRHHKRSFAEALDGHKKHYSVDMIEKWESALSEIAELSGHHLRKEANENEADTIGEIVSEVKTRMSTTVSYIDKHLFGIDSAVKEIYQKLSLESNDVRAIGICGMGGIGKTTIAKAFYNKYINRFDISCFNENVKQYSQGGGHLLPLLKQLLIDLLTKKDGKATDFESRTRKLKQILHSKKSLIILDNLDQSNYSELLENLGNLFSAGSRIVITTRDENLLKQLQVDMSNVYIYKVKVLGEKDSLELFSYHAFRKIMPPENFRELSSKFVKCAGGLPLALKVLGSSLLGRTDATFWKAKLEKLKEIPENRINEILRLSYEELGDETVKSIFLDIAFFFVGEDRTEAVHVFESCHFFPDEGIPILVERCLLTINKDNKFEMHNLIQDMGNDIAKTTHTRLFLRGNAWKDSYLEDTNNIEGLVLDLTESRDKRITTLLLRMSNLRLLHIIGSNDIEGKFINLFPELRCIRWPFCPWTQIPSTFRPPKLVSIDMHDSQFNILWKRSVPIKQLNNLYRLNLGGCRFLKRLPEQLGEMKSLKKIDVSNTAIKKLPDSITRLEGLAELNLFFCKKLAKLPEQFGEMKGLKYLNARLCAIEKLPDSITHLEELAELNLSKCGKLTKLPEQIGNMQGLRKFDAGYTAIEQLPDSFGGLINLETLNLDRCENLRNLSDSIWQLKLLRELDLNCCSKLERLPEKLGEMQCLQHLYAYGTAIEEVPDSIRLLSRLQEFSLDGCKKLKYVPESIWNLTSIKTLHLGSGDIDIISLPDSVEKLNKLTSLILSCNVRLCLPMILRFPSLKKLRLTDEGQILSSTKQVSLSQLFNLQSLSLYKCTSLGSSLPELPSNLEELRLYDHSSLEQLPDLSSLKQLKRLHIKRCISLQSILLLPSNLQLLSVEDCPSLQDLPDLSILKELTVLRFIRCNNLKSISLKQSSLKARQDHFPSFRAELPNREVPEWFDYKSSGRIVSFEIPPSSGSNFLCLALWVVYTCKATHDDVSYIRAVITNNTESITETYDIYVPTVVGEAESSIQCITGEKMSMKSGDRIKVSFSSLMYSSDRVGKVKVKMCGVHII